MRSLKKALLVVLLSCVTALHAWSLDVNEIAQLVRSGVDDAVIMNLVSSNGLPAPLTPNDVVVLNASGASAQLLQFLTSLGMSSGTVATSPTYVQPAQPYPEYYDDDDYYDGDDGLAGGESYYIDENGNYVSVSPTYSDPTVVYPSTSAGVYYDDSPTVYYEESPTYVYPSTTYYPGTSVYYEDYTYPVYGGISIGGSYHHNSYRPSRPNKRPPTYNRPSGGGSRPKPPPAITRPKPPTSGGKPKPPPTTSKPKPKPKPSGDRDKKPSKPSSGGKHPTGGKRPSKR